MSPLIYNGDIVAVDCSAVDMTKLNGKIVVAWNRRTGLTLSRFLHMKGMQLLESENRDYRPIALGKDRNWRIIGKVLWWIRRSQ
jgi:SOS-response transcriptional repressor LexA